MFAPSVLRQEGLAALAADDWWRETFVAGSVWRAWRCQWLPPVCVEELPGGLLHRLQGEGLKERLFALLIHLLPLTTDSCAGFSMGAAFPQKMG